MTRHRARVARNSEPPGDYAMQWIQQLSARLSQSRHARRASAARAGRRREMVLETLEPRILLSGNADLAGGVLTGHLTALSDNVVVALNKTITADGIAADGGLIIDFTVNSVLEHYGDASAGVTGIVLDRLERADTFSLTDALPI